MVKRNPHFFRLQENYLFPEVARRVRLYKEKHPEKELISLSVGDTSQPLSPLAAKGLIQESQELKTVSGYRGYGPEQGERTLRAKIAENLYHQNVEEDEIFVSDGAKCDIGRLQLLFGPNVKIAIQNPTYPVYADAATIAGIQNISLLSCNPENDFFPDLNNLPDVDLLYFCSPNNPTGAAATKNQLASLVDWAKQTRTILIFDSAYAGFIQDPSLPRSIYEIEGAKEVAIEVSSFSKLMGFSGIRLGWTVVPKQLHYENGESVRKDFLRLITTCFNGASIIAQAGGASALCTEGLSEIQKTLAYYLENAKLIKKALQKKELKTFGGDNAPYLWVYFGNYASWVLFQHLLETIGIITTPGSGFGSEGEGYLRLSALGQREQVLNAIARLESLTLPQSKSQN